MDITNLMMKLLEKNFKFGITGYFVFYFFRL